MTTRAWLITLCILVSIDILATMGWFAFIIQSWFPLVFGIILIVILYGIWWAFSGIDNQIDN